MRPVDAAIGALRGVENACAKLRARLRPYATKSHNPFRDCCGEHERDPHAPDCHQPTTENQP